MSCLVGELSRLQRNKVNFCLLVKLLCLRLSIRLFIRTYVWKTRDRRLISLHHCTPDLKIFYLYSDKTRVLTSLRNCKFDLDICFSLTLEYSEEEISYYLDSQKKTKKTKTLHMVFLAISLISKISYPALARFLL